MKRAVLVFSCVFLFAVAAGVARAETLDEVIAKVQKAYAPMKDYQASFVQEVQGPSGTRGASGTIYVKAPAKMRWDYAEPAEKHLITDGYTSWMYLPEEKQVYVQPLDAQASARAPLQMLTGKLDFKKEYDASLLEEQGEQARIQLKPKKPGTGFDHAVMYFDRKSWRLDRFDMFDLYGTRTTVILKDAKFNPGLKDALFVYQNKPGVEVVKAPTP